MPIIVWIHEGLYNYSLNKGARLGHVLFFNYCLFQEVWDSLDVSLGLDFYYNSLLIIIS